MADLCSLTGYTRDQVRGLLDALPPMGQRDGRRRAATSYSLQDLFFISLCCRLEQHYGLKRDKVAVLAPHIGAQLVNPHETGFDHLLVQFDPPSARNVDKIEGVADGLIVALEPVFEQVDGYLLPGGSVRSAVMPGAAKRIGKD
jgi:hypothetical protein